MKSRPLIVTTIVIATTIVAVIGTWYVASSVQSPAQRDAAAAAPSLSPVTVTAKQGNLVDQITATGVIATEQETDINIPIAGGSSVVTESSSAVGDTLSPGRSILRVNGRPLIALTGSFPAYRDLTEGDEGDDVHQLQQALVGLGYSVAVDGQFGPATSKAVKSLYDSVGFAPLTVSQDVTLNTSNADATEESQSSDSSKDSDSTSETTSEKQPSPDLTKKVITVPRSEIIYIPNIDQHSTIAAMPSVGTVLTDTSATITLTSGSARIKVDAPSSTADSLNTGATATASIAGKQYNFVLEKKENPNDSDKTNSEDTASHKNSENNSSAGVGGATAANSTHTLIFKSDRALPPNLTQNDSILLAIDRMAPISDAILIPKRAVASAPDGKHTVLRKDQSGQFTSVDVKLLGCVGGQCAVEDGALSVGDLLRVDGL